MKRLNIIALLLMSLLAFVSCGDDEDNYLTLNEGDIVKPTWQAELGAVEGLVVTEDNMKEVLGSWQWTKAEFGVQSPITYVIDIDTVASFSRPQEVARYTTVGEEVEFTVEQLNSAIQSFLPSRALPKDMKEMTFYINLKAIIGTTGNYAAQYAEPKTIKFTPFPVVKINDIFMIGKDFGDWNWSSSGVVSMIPVNGNSGVFWTVKYLTKGNGFKWSYAKDWDGAFNKLDKAPDGFITDGGDAYVEETGLYMIFIDVNNASIIIKPAEIYGIGGCFKDNWGTGEQFTNVGKLTQITTLTSGELRIYAKAPVEGIDWWRMEFIFFDDGKIEYRGNDGDQSRFSVDAGKIVTLDFNAGTGTVK